MLLPAGPLVRWSMHKITSDSEFRTDVSESNNPYSVDPQFRIDDVSTGTPIRYLSPKATRMIFAGAGELDY